MKQYWLRAALSSLIFTMPVSALQAEVATGCLRNGQLTQLQIGDVPRHGQCRGRGQEVRLQLDDAIRRAIPLHLTLEVDTGVVEVPVATFGPFDITAECHANRGGVPAAGIRVQNETEFTGYFIGARFHTNTVRMTQFVGKNLANPDRINNYADGFIATDAGYRVEVGISSFAFDGEDYTCQIISDLVLIGPAVNSPD